MHAAHYVNTPAVVIWGPTDHEIYGYPEQMHLQMHPACGIEEGCIHSRENEGGKLYSTPCPMGEKHCIDQTRPEGIYEAVQKILKKKTRRNDM